ncbi:folate-binding protein [Kaistia dalseonensis]|uniref:Folate-binding protein YgfZ n=1 Tax=Kaistia dalseonensis TaxID=410840 RepID=A0ABU0HCV5_9HYPH|nr:folate-binding protein [Kaistia dalseonensis]MCX5497511.1 folate-binding protein [Kaistia dalseonensis]MDQ0440150.1 folate-binding protein YgfZ [Kaistia dalseonensis]
MRIGSYAFLADRGVIAIGGPEAEPFLQNIITTDMAAVVTEGAGFGALLSPQGKILFDFIIARSGEEFLFDLPLALAADFLKRMTLYRLRAKVTLENRSEGLTVAAFWNGDSPPLLPGAFADPRLAALGYRAIVPKGTDLSGTGYALASEADYHAARIALAVPEAGRDFAFGDAFPHDADMDDLGGLDFRKGCYVGQEIVSRMQHRGTARRRAVAVTAKGALPATGTPILSDGKPIGALGSADGAIGIALLRLDRAKRALDQGAAITADGVALSIRLPAYAHFGWPESGEEEGAA